MPDNAEPPPFNFRSPFQVLKCGGGIRNQVIKRCFVQVTRACSNTSLGSIGAASDSFVTLLARQYKLPAPATKMVPSVDAAVAGLQGDPAHVLDGMTKMKFFFFDSGPEARYAEVFINVDAKNNMLEFHDKDADYHKPLLLALNQGSVTPTDCLSTNSAALDST